MRLLKFLAATVLATGVSTIVALAVSSPALGQSLGALASPGPLNKVHASLENVTSCLKCHETNKTIVATRCLVCHPLIQQRIAARKGVHRKVTNTCVPCHVEHAGRNVELRPLHRKSFDHAGEAGFPLEGRHAAIAGQCDRCHKTHSFLTLSPACASCHADPHKNQFGTDCARCHSATVPFAETRRHFDHGKTAFALTGAHAAVRCELCHKLGVYKGLRSQSCGDCHKDPHTRPLGTCAKCHTTQGFRTGLTAGGGFDHSTTSFPLNGVHATLPCASCHGHAGKRLNARPPCSSCHVDVHRGRFKEDCASCHRDTGFKAARFDHGARTGFPLVGRHAEQPCAKCHKGAAAQPGVPLSQRVVDFGGARPVCATCHKDAHAGRLGRLCEKCHTPQSFHLSAFKHPRSPEFFAARHAALRCEKCHRKDPAGGPRRFKGTSLACASCHTDPHLGQVGTACKPCHAPAAPGFQVVGFDHARTRYPLTGSHAGLACARCHKCEARAFPAGWGVAVRLVDLPRRCGSCHRDVHNGRLGPRCERCHTTTAFTIKRCARPESPDCVSCHRGAYEKATNPSHTAAGFSTKCTACHRGSDPSWASGTYAHETWPLLGPHSSAACVACHVSGSYRGLSDRCGSCHFEEYQRTTSPAHEARGYATTCEPCHQGSDTSFREAALRTP